MNDCPTNNTKLDFATLRGALRMAGVTPKELSGYRMYEVLPRAVEILNAGLAEQAPAGESARKGLLELREPDEMIAWLNDLNSNWAVCRNTRSFKEGQPSEYWKKFDKAMGAAFELQIALMKLAAGRLSQPTEPRDPEGK